MYANLWENTKNYFHKFETYIIVLKWLVLGFVIPTPINHFTEDLQCLVLFEQQIRINHRSILSRLQ